MIGAGAIGDTARTFRQYLADVLGATFDQSITKLRLFVNFCEMDDVMREVVQPLHRRVDIAAWYRTAASQGVQYRLPTDEGDRVSTLYLVLLKIGRRNIDFRQFLTELMPGASIEAKFGAFLGRMVQPFGESAERLLEGLRARAADGPIAVGEAVEALLAAGPPAEPQALPAPAALAPKPSPAVIVEPLPAAKAAIVTEGDAAEAAPRVPEPKRETPSAEPSREPAPSREAGAPRHEVEIAAIEGALGKSSIEGDPRDDLATDLRIIRIELAKPNPAIDRVREIANALAEIEPLAPSARDLLAALG